MTAALASRRWALGLVLALVAAACARGGGPDEEADRHIPDAQDDDDASVAPETPGTSDDSSSPSEPPPAPPDTPDTSDTSEPPPPPPPPPPPAPICGDMFCDLGEDTSCPQDCATGGSCAHDYCAEGEALDASCDPCVTDVCNDDDYCCTVEWDDVCVQIANVYCACA